MKNNWSIFFKSSNACFSLNNNWLFMRLAFTTWQLSSNLKFATALPFCFSTAFTSAFTSAYTSVVLSSAFSSAYTALSTAFSSALSFKNESVAIMLLASTFSSKSKLISSIYDNNFGTIQLTFTFALSTDSWLARLLGIIVPFISLSSISNQTLISLISYLSSILTGWFELITRKSGVSWCKSGINCSPNETCDEEFFHFLIE